MGEEARDVPRMHLNKKLRGGKTMKSHTLDLEIYGYVANNNLIMSQKQCVMHLPDL